METKSLHWDACFSLKSSAALNLILNAPRSPSADAEARVLLEVTSRNSSVRTTGKLRDTDIYENYSNLAWHNVARTNVLESAMRKIAMLIIIQVLLSACASNGNANYPPLTHAFGKVVRLDGQAEAVRDSETRELGPGDALFVGEEVSVRSGAVVAIVLASGQVVKLSGSARWRIDKAVSNGAAFGSETTLRSGSFEILGEEYMPHTLKIVTPLAEVSTFSENFRLTLDAAENKLTAQSLDATPITLTNAAGELALEAALAVAVVEGRLPPRIK
jgi:hypothetical protein